MKINFIFVLTLIFILTSANVLALVETRAEVQLKSRGNEVNSTKIADRLSNKTGLNITAEGIEEKIEKRFNLSNGRYASIKVMPETASANALARLNAKCSERNCTVELKEAGRKNETRAVYIVSGEKESRLLGIFRNRMKVSAEVDAETGEILRTKKPWWAFLARENRLSANATVQ